MDNGYMFKAEGISNYANLIIMLHTQTLASDFYYSLNVKGIKGKKLT